jgi:Holliday junction resolvase RusA-like endonuclease
VEEVSDDIIMDDEGSEVAYELSYPPSVNHYWRHVGDRTLISRAGREYRQRITDELAHQGVTAAGGSIALFISVHPPDRRRRDLDNILKALLDALQHGGAYQDDSQIDSLQVVRSKPVPGGKVMVEITETRS